ncbi:Transcription factor spt20 [Hypocenomyce scalaris]|nr:Transcription factor spt20 [Hypocenomyce scalaris]
MATAVATKPAPMPQKMKRPPPPSVQTGVNGVKSSQSSPSPSLSSKRPPSGTKLPPSSATMDGVNGGANGSVPRISNRRREPQKPGDIQGRPYAIRGSKGTHGSGSSLDRRSAKRLPEPYVRTTSHILQKFRKSPPSLILHLHPTHFRFDQQDGSFSYNSPMKVILEHIRNQTVPHDMLEELFASHVKFYEGCLIVQIQDHRVTPTDSQASSLNASANDKNIPFSVHNYNEHLTPSPFVPYPQSTSSNIEGGKRQIEPATSENQPNLETADSEKENLLGPSGKAQQEKPSKGPKIFTTVLFSTPMSLQEEVMLYANTPDPKAAHRKHSQATISSRTPGSSTMPHPPTPLSAVPPTPTGSIAPPAKRQKMLVSGNDLPTLESKLIQTTAPPLYLEPVDNLQDAQEVIRILKHPLHEAKPPSPKARKRTVAELAADEAFAAEEQRFMLIMDERLAPTSTNAATTSADGESGAASFEPRFERFKTLEDIKIAHQEKARREHEAKLQQQAQIAAAKAQQEQAERERRQTMEQAARENTRRETQMRQYQTQNQLQQQAQQQAKIMAMQQQQQQQLAASQSQHAHPPTNGMMPGAQQHNMIQASQAHQSSPIVRNMTPHSQSSPIMMGHPGQSVPMNLTLSGQGVGSPPRPGSALQHAHPGVAVQMPHQRSQQGSSRNGTPQMPNGTPSLAQATPVMRHVTPTPMMSRASPANSAMAQTPVMMHKTMSTPQINGANLTPQQHQMLMQQRQQQALQHQQQQQMHSSPPTNQMSPAHLQQLAAQQAHNAEAQRLQQQQRLAYQQQLQHQMQQQIQAGANPQIVTGNMPPAPTPQQHVQQQQQQQQQQQLNNGQPRPQINPQHQQMLQQRQHFYFQKLIGSAQQQFGTQVPPHVIQQLKHRSAQMTNESMAHQQRQMQQRSQHAQAAAQQQQQQQQQQAMMAQMAANGGWGMGGVGGQ